MNEDEDRDEAARAHELDVRRSDRWWSRWWNRWWKASEPVIFIIAFLAAVIGLVAAYCAMATSRGG